MHKYAAFFAITLTAAAVAADPASDKKAVKQLQGVWQAKKLVKGGKSAPAKVIEATAFKFEGMKMMPVGKGIALEFTVDASKKPAWINLVPGDGPKKGKTLKGIYSVEKGTMRMCLRGDPDGKRPTKFDTGNDGDLFLGIFERKK